MMDLLTRYNLRPPTPMGYPYFSGEEVVENLINEFNQMPPQFTTDPATGKVIATKNMPKPYGPPSLDPPYQSLFRSPNNPNWGMEDPFLRSSWVLPQGALTGDKFIERTPPTSDYSRQSAEMMGIGGAGPTTTSLNPQTHWPETAFRVPIREPNIENPYAWPEPVFNSTVDYTKNRFHVPPIPNAWSQSYGAFEGGTPPGYGTQPISPVQPTDLNQMLRQSLLRRMI